MELKNLKEAEKLAWEAMTPRAKEIDRLERYWYGTQYAGKPSFWDKTKPLEDRQPCVRYNLTKVAIREFRANITGEDAFPDVTSRNAWDDSEELINEEDAKAVDMAMDAIKKQSRFQAICGDALSVSMRGRSIAAVYGFRAGRLFGDIIKGSWCTPKWDRKTGEISELEIKYTYVDKNLIRDGHYVARAMWYRRVIDKTRDIVYKPVEFERIDEKPRWVEDPEQTFSHGLGFCPVVWYPFERGCQIEGRIDGYAIQEGIEQELENLDMLLSVKYRAALRSEGQWVEIGVEVGYNPSEGKQPEKFYPSGNSAVNDTPLPFSQAERGYQSLPNAANGGVRRSGSDEIWQYEAEDGNAVKVDRITVPGDALKAMADCANDQKNKLGDMISVVFIDPENLPKGAAMSGTALLALRKRFFERCNEIRSDFGDNFIVPSYGVMLRIAAKAGLRVPGMKKAKGVIAKLEKEKLWTFHCPPLSLSWGDYERPDPEEGLALMQSIQLGLECGILTKRIAVKMLRAFAGIEDVDAYLKELETHLKKEEAKLAETEQAAADDQHDKALELTEAKGEMAIKAKKLSGPAKKKA